MDKFGLEGQGLTLDNILSNKDDATLSLQLMGENIFCAFCCICIEIYSAVKTEIEIYTLPFLRCT